jgi:hypothetical protein
MPTLNLASSSLGQLYSLPANDWHLINQRADIVVYAGPQAADIAPELPAFPALLESSTRWKQSTFGALTAQAQALAGYAATAIQNFSSLDTEVKAASSTGIVPDSLKQLTLSCLQKLAADTAPLASASSTLSAEVLRFLNDNIAVDAQIAAQKSSFGIFWPSVQATITALEDAAGLMVGEWRAITDDLTATLASPIDVTMPFLESLNIEGALVSWQNVQAEAGAFASQVAVEL